MLISQAQAQADAHNNHPWLFRIEPAHMKRYFSLIRQIPAAQKLGERNWGLWVVMANINMFLHLY